MRILAIRGCNLASLAGAFEVDFRSEPLHSAGLFAISGPTGAGKSTLLDALCLALYEATPRLARAGSRGIALPDVKEETVTPQDVRNLLRRGATEGHAEVDFLGNDGIAYRARWSVRRARNRSDGRLQDSEMRLWQLPELQPLGGRNVEVKAEIARRVGLNFEQFTRAVLLAQNEFSAFLKAGDNERGELLETLTGSGIYTEISRLAFERAKEETTALERLTERLEHALPLADEERQRLESEVGAARARLAQLEARHAAHERLLHWQNESRALQLALDEARLVRERRRQELQSADAQRARLAEVEAAQGARALLSEHARLATEAEACRAAIAECESRLARANEARQASERAKEDAALALRAAEAQHAELANGLDEARALDARIDAMHPEHAQSRRNADDAAAAAAEARATLEARIGERASLSAQIEQLDAWLNAHAADGAMAAQWQRCDILLVQARDHRGLALAAAGAASAAARAQGDGETIEQRHAQAHDAATLAVEARRRERDACSERLRALEAKRTPGARVQIAGEQQQLLEAERLCRALHDAQLRRSEALDDMMRHAEALAAAQRSWQEAQAAQPGIAAALAQAERSQKRAEAAASASVEQLRASLSDGEPCPVCGASDHPYRHADLSLKSMLSELADEVAACREAARRNTEALATQRALADAALAAQKESERRIAEHDAALTAAGQAWVAHALHGSDPALSGPPHACAAWLAQRQSANAERIREIDAAEQAYAAAATERDAAQSALDAAATHAESCRAALDATRQANAEAARQVIAARERERDAHARLDAGLDALDALDPPPLPRDWRSAWHAAPEDFHRRCLDAVSGWEAQRALRAAASTRSAALDAELQAASERSAATEAERQRTAAEHALRDAALRTQQDARAALFGGRPVTQVQAEGAARIAAARAAQDAAASAERQSALEAMRCAEARERTHERHRELQMQQQEGATRIAAWLADHNAGHQWPLDAARLGKLLEHDAEWIRAQREALAALEAALREAEAVHSERERRLAAHGAARDADWPEIAADELGQALDALRNERQSAMKEGAALELALSADDQRRVDAAETRLQLERQQAAQRRWAQLSELIGSADGKKFRNYAQQTTLDVLLAYANRHLSDLARRYRLERVRETLALLVIDGDMGGEMRSVHSLSGGESFLVSLALALGLASLSSNGVRVESLFIDEGFGSLDADTLRVAMDALDGLQAMGRKVGVISHVQDMTERIATRILVRRVAGGRSQVSVAQGL